MRLTSRCQVPQPENRNTSGAIYILSDNDCQRRFRLLPFAPISSRTLSWPASAHRRQDYRARFSSFFYYPDRGGRQGFPMCPLHLTAPVRPSYPGPRGHLPPGPGRQDDQRNVQAAQGVPPPVRHVPAISLLPLSPCAYRSPLPASPSALSLPPPPLARNPDTGHGP